MKHVILATVCMLGFGVAAFFVFRLLHHGAIDELVFEKKGSVDTSLQYFSGEELYSDEISTILFGRRVFDRVHPGLERAISMQEIFNAGGDIHKGWVFKSDEENRTSIARIYWNDTTKWQSNWRHLAGDRFAVGDTIRSGIRNGVSGTSRSFLTGEEEWLPSRIPGEEEVIFGKDAFAKAFPRLEQVLRVKNMATPPEALFRGWIVSDDNGDTDYRRVYWDETSYWVSDWKHLRGDAYVENGIQIEPSNRAWDGTSGSNHAVMIGILFGFVLGAVVAFGFLEAIFWEPY